MNGSYNLCILFLGFSSRKKKSAFSEAPFHQELGQMKQAEPLSELERLYGSINLKRTVHKIKVIALVSGGVDSVTALYHCREYCCIVSGLTFDYGSKHNRREIPYAAFHCKRLGIPHRVICLEFMGRFFTSALLEADKPVPDGHYEELKMKQTVVPFRNGIFLAIAGGFAESTGASAVVIGAHSGDHAIYPDCREQFMEFMSEALHSGTYTGVEIQRPFIGMRKSEIVHRGDKLGVDFAETWSCYNGRDRHCGTCGTCVERREAFVLAGLPDPTHYEKMLPRGQVGRGRRGGERSV